MHPFTYNTGLILNNLILHQFQIINNFTPIINKNLKKRNGHIELESYFK